MLGQKFMLIVVAAGYALAQTVFDEDCDLNGQSLYGWMVRIWSKQIKSTVAEGSIISQLAVISGCSTMGGDHFRADRPQEFEIIGQKCRDTRNWQDVKNWCSQKRAVQKILRHPKCLDDQEIPEAQGSAWTVNNIKHAFDFAIFVIETPFTAFSSGFTDKLAVYPTFTLPVTPRRFLMELQYLKAQTEPICEIPIYKQRNDRIPAFLCDKKDNARVRPVPLDSGCTDSMCADPYFIPDSARHQASKCAQFYQSRANGTALCSIPDGWASKVQHPTREKSPIDNLFWQVGAPFACNGTSYGHAGWFSLSGNVYPYGSTDFFYVVTYLRVWPWIQGAMYYFGANKWVKELDLDSVTLETVRVAPPSAAPIHDQVLPFRIPIRTVNLQLPKQIDEPWQRSDCSLLRIPHLPIAAFFILEVIVLGR